MDIDSIQLTDEDFSHALHNMAQHALEKGYVDDEYEEALLSRENNFPTGLAMEGDFGIAIPHADPEHVHEPLVLLGLPDEPIPFQSMEDPDETVDAELVVLLIIKETEGYVQFLSRLVTLFQESEFSEHVRDRDLDRVNTLIREHCLENSE